MKEKHRNITSVSAADEALIQAQIAADPDDGDATEEDLAQAKPFAEVFPDLFESIRRARGRPVQEQTKTPVTIRLDPDVVEHFKGTGKGWQSRMNTALRKAAGL
ncbi:BrnA antitoxin family protein [Pararhizobium sp.]|uniref:BrnA antitoxin family protein n=1 Tax=Pararhizobium sp. TaxID=1977563 RepID=UPI00271B75FB|nr:BrnA antitoxin family protein [Pararhizobium sp.]MDO9417338.1 BrnA antitoxin family protein [Pararhizobium sp.]